MVKDVIHQCKTEQENPINFELMLEELEGDKVLFFGIVDRFFRKVKTQLTSLQEAIAAHNLEAIVFTAHSICGGASNLGMCKLAKVAFHLEKVNLAKDSSPEDNYVICEELATELDYLTTYVSKLIVKTAN